MQLDVHDGAGSHTPAGIHLGVALERLEETGLVHHAGDIAGPAFGHGPATEHSDARGAVHGGDAADARGGVVGVPVLHMMANAAVVNDVVELDHAVVVFAQEGNLVVERGARVQRVDQVVVHRRAVDRGRRTVERKMEIRADCTRPLWPRHILDGKLRPRDQVIADGCGSAFSPDIRVARIVDGCGGTDVGEVGESLCRGGRAEVCGVRVEKRGGVGQRVFGISDDVVAAEVEDMAVAHQQVEGLFAAGIAVAGPVDQVRAEIGAILGEGGGRDIGRGAQPSAVQGFPGLDALLGEQIKALGAEQGESAFTLTNGALSPGHGGAAHVVPSLLQEGRDGVQPVNGCAHPLAEGRVVGEK